MKARIRSVYCLERNKLGLKEENENLTYRSEFTRWPDLAFLTSVEKKLELLTALVTYNRELKQTWALFRTEFCQIKDDYKGFRWTLRFHISF